MYSPAKHTKAKTSKTMSLRLIVLALGLCLSMQLGAQNIQKEHRGVWLATVDGLDWPRKENLHFAQREDLINTIKGLAELGCNTLYFQVVSEMDAMYSSELLPWSRHLTGEEGMSPYFDPLSLAVKVSHDCGMSIHAWINPLRVSVADTTARSISQVKYAHPEWVHNYEGKEYLDPGNPEVLQFLSDIAREILEKYDVDGLHIDDYFYPWGLRSDKRKGDEPGAWDDADLYAQYGEGKSLEEWRFSNIDKVVETLHQVVHDTKEGAVFGVSPQGLIVNTCMLYADPKRWVSEKSLDYLVPQLYWSMDRGDAAAFPKALEEWKELAEEIPLYIGIAAYKHNPIFYRRKKDSGFKNVAEFKRQIDLLRSTTYTNGHVWFRARDILEREELRNYIVSQIYK